MQPLNKNSSRKTHLCTASKDHNQHSRKKQENKKGALIYKDKSKEKMENKSKYK